MIFQLSGSPLRLEIEFHSVVECVTKDGKNVKETDRKHTIKRSLAEARKSELEEELLRKNWLKTSGDRFQKDDAHKWFVIQKRAYSIELD